MVSRLKSCFNSLLHAAIYLLENQSNYVILSILWPRGIRYPHPALFAEYGSDMKRCLGDYYYFPTL